MWHQIPELACWDKNEHKLCLYATDLTFEPGTFSHWLGKPVYFLFLKNETNLPLFNTFFASFFYFFIPLFTAFHFII
jgi:hypothetical protein